MSEEGDPTFFGNRGIPEEIWRARPYLWWTPDNPEPATAAFVDLDRGQRAFVSKLVRQSPGWVISRHPPPLAIPLPPVYPELRPMHPVKTRGPRVHWHGDGGEPEGLTWGQKMPGSRKDWQDHIRRSKAEDDHHGLNTDEVHSHQEVAKYVFATKARTDGAYVHDHDRAWSRVAVAKRPEHRRRHVERRHPDGEAHGPHIHVVRVPDPEAPPMARRLDVHPLAVDLLVRSSVVFFVIEGCIKADAVLADGGAVFSVPSVSLWDCVELGRFANEYLVGKTVVIVPDADWASNDAVINQARLCENRLRQFAVKDTHVAAPPPTLGKARTKGVDDFIGAGGHLEDLIVIDHEPPRGLYEYVIRQWSFRRDRARRDAEVLTAIANYVGERGVLEAPLTTVARVMNVNTMRVSRAVHDLEQLGAVIVEGDPSTRRSWFSGQHEWTEKPRLVLAPELRPKTKTPQPLGAVLDEPIRQETTAA